MKNTPTRCGLLPPLLMLARTSMRKRTFPICKRVKRKINEAQKLKKGKPATTMEQSVVCVNRKPNGIQSVLHGPTHICHNSSTVSKIAYKLYKSESYVTSESKIEIIDCNFVSRQKGANLLAFIGVCLGSLQILLLHSLGSFLWPVHTLHSRQAEMVEST